MSYTGKMFEEDFFEGAKEFDSQALVTRLYDTTNGFRGVANPCDYIAATEYGTVFLELKTTIEASLSFNNITENQWFQLSRAERCKFSLAGILVYFQKHEKIIWYPISTLEEIKRSGVKSVNPNFIEGYEVAYKKRRTRLTIPFENVLDAIKLHYEEKSNGKT
nr:MAG TPA: penicillin-binding protein-related factor A [Caudoviricetes sp.]